MMCKTIIASSYFSHHVSSGTFNAIPLYSEMINGKNAHLGL